MRGRYRIFEPEINFHANGRFGIKFHESSPVFMPRRKHPYFSGPVAVLHERRLPEVATPVGYAALIDAYHLQAPVPLTLAAVGEHHKLFDADGWRLFTPRHAPAATLDGHVTFALKYEGLDLVVLKRLFVATGPNPIADWLRDQPTGRYARRIWFLYESLTGRRLNLPNVTQGNYVNLLDLCKKLNELSGIFLTGLKVFSKEIRN